MSTLLIDELYNGVLFSQNFKISRSTNLAHIRPWIYVEGTLVDGDFTCVVKDGATELATASVNYTLINAAKTDTYVHGFIRFDFDVLTLRVPEGVTEKEYTIEFSMQNHTTDTSNYLAIVRRWELKTYDTYGTGVINNEAPNDSIEPAGLEFFEYKEI